MESRKFRKRPIVVEAFQTDEELIIPTLEGDLKASKGDWIITGIRGEQYPCKPDVFERTYDEIYADEAVPVDWKSEPIFVALSVIALLFWVSWIYMIVKLFG